MSKPKMKAYISEDFGYITEIVDDMIDSLPGYRVGINEEMNRLFESESRFTQQCEDMDNDEEYKEKKAPYVPYLKVIRDNELYRVIADRQGNGRLFYTLYLKEREEE